MLFAADRVERQDVVAEAVTVLPSRPPDPIGQIRAPAAAELALLLAQDTAAPVLFLQLAVIDVPAAPFPSRRPRGRLALRPANTAAPLKSSWCIAPRC